jgi:hypothetical protein
MHFTLFLRMSGKIILIPWLRVSSRQLKDDIVSEVWILELSGLYPVTPGTGPRVTPRRVRIHYIHINTGGGKTAVGWVMALRRGLAAL